MTIDKIQAELAALADPQLALNQQRFFKTGPGEYGEGDLFRGIRVPVLRKLSKTYQAITIPEAEKLLHSPYHENRLLALLILVRIYAKGDAGKKETVYQLYLRNTAFVNNWDLVDSSAHYIVGPHLMGKRKEVLYELAQSSLLWERRIAILATFHFIKCGEFEETLKIARMLLNDKHDLIHKAVGWMLREVGKRDLEVEEAFLRPVYQQMPRTMLRYAIERFEKEKRQRYLKGQI